MQQAEEAEEAMSLKDQQAKIEKTIQTSDFLNGGQLNPEQQAAFLTLVRKNATFLPSVRFVRMTHAKMDIDKLHIGEPVTEAASENADTGNYSKVKFNKVSLAAVKVRSAWNLTTESLQENLEQEDFEGTVFAGMTGRIATDLEMLAIRGDTSIVGTDPVSRLLKTLDGWDKQTEFCHVIDAQGAEIEQGMFEAALDAMPDVYRNDPNLRWVASDSLWNDWRSVLGQRGTALGDQAIAGGTVTPMGIPGQAVPLIPKNKPIAISGSATPASVLGTQMGPFVITAGVNDKLNLNVDGVGVVVVTLPAGTLECARVANAINVQLGNKSIARDNNEGQLLLTSLTTGASSSIAIGAQATNAYTTLGLTIAVTTGAASGGTVNEGTFLLLCNPQNLIFGMVNATRVFASFNQIFDRIDTIVFNQLDCKLENVDAIVKVKNIRRRKKF